MMIAKNILIESMIKLLDRHQEVVPSLQKKANDEIIRQAETIAKLARITKKETLNIFLYNSKIELMRTQLMMIDLADHLISYADEGDEKIRKIYYETLKLILNRGELDISQIGFDESFNFLLDQASLANRKLDKNTLLKMDVGLAYQQFLYKALEKVLHKLNLKGGEEKEMDFIDNFCAIAYFQIPEFRIKLLECAQKETDTEITEWRGTEWKLEDLVMDNQRDQYLLSLFNWEAVFYRFLKVF